MNTAQKIQHLQDAIEILERLNAEPNVTTCEVTIAGLRKMVDDLEDVTPKRQTSFVVKALLKSDDENVSDHVEAAEWLEHCNTEMLAYMCEDTGSNEDTDDLFWYLDGELGSNAWGIHVAQRLGRYLSAINESNSRDTVGFSVRLDEDDLHAWVQKNRPEAWKKYEEENA